MHRRHHHPPPPPPHHHHHHHHPPPPPPHHHHHHPPPPPPPHHHHHPPPPAVVLPPLPPPIVVVDHHHHTPPTVVHHHSDEIFSRPTVKVYCKADVYLSLSIRNGQLVLARSNPSDPLQQWIRDDRHSTRVRDAEGLPSFALINKATAQALRHSIGVSHPVELVQYNPNVYDESILWSDKYLEDGYRVIRMVNNIRLNMEAASHGGFFHGGIQDGSILVLQDWKNGDNQRWDIIPHSM